MTTKKQALQLAHDVLVRAGNSQHGNAAELISESVAWMLLADRLPAETEPIELEVRLNVGPTKTEFTVLGVPIWQKIENGKTTYGWLKGFDGRHPFDEPGCLYRRSDDGSPIDNLRRFADFIRSQQ